MGEGAMTRDELYDILRFISSPTESLALIWGQPFDGETEKIKPVTEESSVVGNSGNETDFVTKSMTADEIMAGKMAYNLHQIREQLLALGKYQTNLLGGGGWDILVTMISDAERVHSHLCRRWNTPTPNPPNQ